MGAGGRPAAPGWTTGAGLRGALGAAGGELAGRLEGCGAPGAARRLRGVLDGLGGGAAPGEVAGELGLLADAAWEKLRTGNYAAVDEAWRDLFAVSAFGRAAAAAAGGHPVRALEHLDAALLFGAAAFRPAVQTAAEGVQQSLRGAGKRKREGQQCVLGEDSCLAGLPEGSLEARAGRGASVERLERPSLDAFAGVQQRGQPAEISGAIDHWSALERWRDVEYLEEALGARHVPVEVGRDYTSSAWTQKVVRLGHFLQESFGGREGSGAAGTDGGAASGDGTMYLAQFPLFDHTPALRRDFSLPDYCCLGHGELLATNAWLGPRGTVTPWHTDPHQNLLAQVVGKKYVRLAPPEAAACLYPFSSGLTTNTSRVDALAPDLEEFPRYADVPFLDCLLEPGAMLYIPPGWWHYVQSASSSFSVSFWWK